MSTDDTWREFFESHVRRAFDFLIARYGYQFVASALRAPECYATYQNPTTRITIAFELGTGPRVEMEQDRGEGYDLEFLLMERAPEERSAVQIQDLDDPRLPGELVRLAQLLRRYGADILAGDFSVFPRLRRRAKEHFERTTRELYGK